MRAFSYIAALSLVGAILVASTSFTDRRSVKTWAPNTVVLKPKPLETAALVSPKHDAAAGTLKAEGASLAAPEQLSSAEAPTRSSTTVTDPESTGTLPKQVEQTFSTCFPMAAWFTAVPTTHNLSRWRQPWRH